VSTITKNVLSFLILSLILSFVLLFIALFVYYNRTLDEAYLIGSPLRNGLVMRDALKGALGLLPPFILFNFITAFSIYYTLSPFQTESFAFSTVAVPSFVILLLLILLTIFSEFFFIPVLEKGCEQLRFRARMLDRAVPRAEELYAQGRFQESLEILDLYRDEDMSNENANLLYRNIRKALEEESTQYSPEETPAAEEEAPLETSYEKGKAAYESGDYFVALFYLERALSLHSGNREIQELLARTREKTASLLGSLTKTQQETRWLVQNKTRALSYLDNGQYYEAYALFSEIHDRYPQLADIRLYLERVRGELQRVDFLPPEMAENAWLPSYDHVVFFDRGGYLNAVERIIPWRGDYYFYDITRYRTGGGGAVEKWPYGKWLDGRIRLKKENSFKKVDEGEMDRYFIVPYVPPGYVALMGDRSLLMKQLSLYERIELTEDLILSGLDMDTVPRYIAREAGVFFSIYVLTLIFSGIAWSKRSIYEFPPFFKLIIFLVTVPILAFIAHHIYTAGNDMLLYLHRYVLRAFGNMSVLLFVLVIQAAVSFFATFYFLSQRSGVE
jgi:tetratricopeptide (TPR) repeat protein